MPRITFLIILIMLLGFALRPGALAQAPVSSPAKIIMGGSVSTHVSYTGLGLTAGFSLKRNDLALIIGPKLSLTNSYRLASGPWGGAASIYYFTTFSAARRLQGFANLDYQNLWQRSYCPTGDCGRQRNITHEISLGYGFDYGLTSRLSVFNAINVGLYRESLPNRFRDERIKVQGLNMLVKLGLLYSFGNEG